MTDFFDWLTAGDSGLAADRLADSFKLTQQEMRKTAEALAPAYTLALQRAMTDPAAWCEITRSFLPFLRDGGSEPDRSRNTAARQLTDTLFGSHEITAQVARQVSLACGIAPDTVEKMMRSLSVMTMQTMVQMMLANMARHQPPGLAEGDYPTAMAEMMRRGANAVEAMGRPSDSPAGGRRRAPTPSDYLMRMFSEALNGSLPMMPPAETRGRGRSDGKERSSAPAEPATISPFEAMLQGFARGLADAEPGEKPAEQADQTPAAPEAPADTPEPETATDGADASSATVDAFDEFARAGQAMQSEYARQMNAIFDLYRTKPAGEDGDG